MIERLLNFGSMINFNEIDFKDLFVLIKKPYYLFLLKYYY